MIVTGVSRVHNAAVTLIKDGEVLFHLENERLSNIKYDAYPFLALNELPKYVDYVDNIGIAGVAPCVPVETFTKDDVYSVYIARLRKSFFMHGPISAYDLWPEHHKMHAACAFYNSGFTEAVCIIKDGVGSEFTIESSQVKVGSYGREASTTYQCSYPANFDLVDKQIAVPFKANLPISSNIYLCQNVTEGHAFQLVSVFFGFHTLDAGKVMGMASYGRADSNIPPIYDEDGYISKKLFPIPSGDLRLAYLNVEEFPYLNTDDFQIRANLAYALQQATQSKVKQDILTAIEKTKCKNVCLSGGYFLNCVANYEYLKDLPDDVNIYIEPISSDAGTSFGAAKILWHDLSGDATIRPQKTIYYGLKHNYTLDDIKSKLKDETYTIVTPADVAKIIADKNIVAMYQGASEAGPRALGNRSILYDPRDPDGKDHVNTVKNREWFRPFAGTVLHEKTNDWFDMRGLKESPFMMYAVDVFKEKQSIIPAITHIDGTCRVQTLTREQNKNYYDLISEFEKITGVPILFNTSFNLAGDCIAETIDDADRRASCRERVSSPV